MPQGESQSRGESSPVFCRLTAVKKAADAANRRLCFVGMSLNTYLEAAHNVGMAPFDPRELIAATDLDAHDPNDVMIVTTGSQVRQVLPGGGGAASGD